MKPNLTEKQEILLCRLFDGDLGLVNRVKAKWLVRGSASARDFLASLESISVAVSAPEIKATSKRCDLWTQISQRIEAEERAAVFLGERPQTRTDSVHHADRSAWYQFFSTQALLGGLSGAATTAVVLFVVTSMRAVPTPLTSNGVGTAANSSGAVLTQASLASNGFENSRGPYSSALSSSMSAASSRPTLLNGRDRSIMEVDWMRGDGPLRVIQNPSEKSTIIWVKRQGTARAAPNKPSQVGRANGAQRLPQLVLTHAPAVSEGRR